MSLLCQACYEQAVQRDKDASSAAAFRNLYWNALEQPEDWDA